MLMLIYILVISITIVYSHFACEKQQLHHAVYTRMIYPAVGKVISFFARGKPSLTSVDFMVLYGNKGNKEQVVTEMAANISSLVLFMLIPVTVNTFSDPGSFGNFICFALAGLGYFIPMYDLKQRAAVEREAILRDFPVFCMDLAVLAKAGLGLEKAWVKALKNKPGSSFYKEARMMSLRMETGVSLEESIIMFARRLGIPEIYSFATVVSQAFKSGESGTSDVVRDFAIQSWNDRYRRAKEKGEKASVKMVFPLAMSLGGIILIVAFPAFAAMKGMIQ
jgi:tight adherence protein C